MTIQDDFKSLREILHVYGGPHAVAALGRIERALLADQPAPTETAADWAKFANVEVHFYAFGTTREEAVEHARQQLADLDKKRRHIVDFSKPEGSPTLCRRPGCSDAALSGSMLGFRKACCEEADALLGVKKVAPKGCSGCANTSISPGVAGACYCGLCGRQIPVMQVPQGAPYCGCNEYGVCGNCSTSGVVK